MFSKNSVKASKVSSAISWYLNSSRALKQKIFKYNDRGNEPCRGEVISRLWFLRLFHFPGSSSKIARYSEGACKVHSKSHSTLRNCMLLASLENTAAKDQRDTWIEITFPWHELKENFSGSYLGFETPWTYKSSTSTVYWVTSSRKCT